MLKFLSWLHHSGYQYRTINVYRSAISSVLPFVDNLPFGQHYIVKHLMKGILKENPPLPKYTVLWDVDLVLSYLKDLPDNKDLSLKVLSKKLAILLAIADPKRVSELARLNIRFMKLTPEYVVFRLYFRFGKIQRNCTAKEVTYRRFDESICVFECLCVYLEAT